MIYALFFSFGLFFFSILTLSQAISARFFADPQPDSA
jgi:hypothetical protein